MDSDALRQLLEHFIPFNRHLGVRVPIVERGFVRMEVPFRDEFVGDPLRPALHGGILSTVADTAGGAAVWASLEDSRARVSTIDLRIDYLRPGKLDTIVCEARLVRLGNRVGVADMKVFNAGDADTVIATGKGVYNITVTKPRAVASSG